jgi:hypothetical protein
LALWLRFGGGDLFLSWQAFAGQLAGLPPEQVRQLRLNEQEPIRPIAIGPTSRPWWNPLGNLILLRPALHHLRLIYFFPNLAGTFISDPAQARSLVMAALETLNEAGAKNVAMNGIQGNSHELNGQIAQVMADAANEWLEMGIERHRSEVSIRHINLVDLRGGFGDAPLA